MTRTKKLSWILIILSCATIDIYVHAKFAIWTLGFAGILIIGVLLFGDKLNA